MGRKVGSVYRCYHELNLMVSKEGGDYKIEGDLADEYSMEDIDDDHKRAIALHLKQLSETMLREVDQKTA